VVAVCDIFSVSRAGYYAWQSQRESARQQRDRELMPIIRDLFWKHRRRYGARRIAVELAAMGEPCGVERVARLLKN
jgi:transposase InsO family protein